MTEPDDSPTDDHGRRRSTRLLGRASAAASSATLRRPLGPGVQRC